MEAVVKAREPEVDGRSRGDGATAPSKVAPPHEHRGVLAPLTAAVAGRIQTERSGEVLPRDPDFIRRLVRPISRYVRYFSPEVRGTENLPLTGPVLLVGNHSCLFYMPEIWTVALAIAARRGIDSPAYVLAHDVLFGFPLVGPALRRLGAVPAGGEEAERVLRQEAPLLVYPGGDFETCRPWTERNQIMFAGRTGFVRLALRTGAPVVPVVGYGAHHAVVVLSRGERLARMLGLNRLRIKAFPILLTPFGLTSIVMPPPPLPSSITVEFMDAIDWSRYGPDAADDERIVRACYEEVTSAMQRTLDRLHDEHPHPVLEGCSHLLRNDAEPMDLPED